jgi:hypothetical protein
MRRFSLTTAMAAVIGLSTLVMAQPADASIGSFFRDRLTNYVGLNDYNYGGAPYRSNRIVNRLFGQGVGYDQYGNYPSGWNYQPDTSRGLVGRLIGDSGRGLISRYAGRILTGAW